ncbi:MAG: serine/threonine-protein phosphatase [Actinomycetaceae bacterium]|nr:serine/threonine-protein phosphatase [Actinomycetaceae bacterium]
MSSDLKIRASAYSTDVGRYRTRNEDRVYLGSHVYAVADGMGGQRSGDQAADLLVGELTNADSRISGSSTRADIELHICSAVRDAAGLISDMVDAGLQQDTETRVARTPGGAGTTVAGIVMGELPIAFHVGDSRVYRYRPDSSELVRITRDHSIVQELVDCGELTAEEAHTHPRRNVITRAIGTYGDPLVEFTSLDIRDSDVVMICSDGLSDELMDEQIATIMEDTYDDGVQAMAYALRDVALSAGGHDNITIIAVEIGESS